MPWKDTSKMQQRREFVLRALDPGSNMAALCREYQISRNTGYKWLRRFREEGLLGLEDRPRHALGTAFRESAEVALDVIHLRHVYPHFGPKKLRELLKKRYPEHLLPSVSTIGRMLKRAGMTKPRRRPRLPKYGPVKRPELIVDGPNDLWTIDFKGWFRTRDGKKCEPLTVRDQYSRFVLGIDIVAAPSVACVRPVFERLFARYGLPKAIQSDNGSPFATTRSRTGLTQLSAWFVSLGIRFVRSRVGKPQDNGGHERMHRDIKDQLQRFPAATPAQQQEYCDTFRSEFNFERPHEGLEQQLPGDVYSKSNTPFTTTNPELVYPKDFYRRKVTKDGNIRYRGLFKTVGKPFAGNYVGIHQVTAKRITVWFGDLCIGVTELPWNGPLKAAGHYNLQQEQQALERANRQER